MQGLESFATMVTPFDRVVDYRRYLFRYKINFLTADEYMDVYYFNRRIEGRHPCLGTFTGDLPIKVFPFLATMMDDLNTTGVLEATGIRVIAY